jgi:type II secretory pathway pseudopilin PulG
MSKLFRSHRPDRRRTSAGGFTMVELLIYVALAGGILAMIAGVTVSNIRSTSNLELRLRAVDLWGRISRLIESEIIEAETISSFVVPLPADPLPGSTPDSTPDPLPKECIGALDPNDITPKFSLTIPYLNNNSKILDKVNIYYYQVPYFDPTTKATSVELWRCGPRYQATGQLDYADPIKPSLLGKRTSLTATTGTDNRSLTYDLSMTTPKGEPIYVHPSKQHNEEDDDHESGESNSSDDATTIRTRIQPTMP